MTFGIDWLSVGLTLIVLVSQAVMHYRQSKAPAPKPAGATSLEELLRAFMLRLGGVDPAQVKAAQAAELPAVPALTLHVLHRPLPADQPAAGAAAAPAKP